MPELPEVETTVDGLNKTVKGHTIENVWSDYKSAYHKGKDNIKNPAFYKIFKKRVIGASIKSAERRAKNVLIHLDNGYTIIAHMKLTGYFVYNKPDEKYLRLKFTLDNGKFLGFSDLRRFAKVTIVKTSELDRCFHLENLGPEPLDPTFQLSAFNLQLKKRPRGKIKLVLMDQSLIAGIGNIYSDEILWRAGVHPASIVDKIPEPLRRKMFQAMKITLRRGIDFGGDSMSDYRNIRGERGRFQEEHRAYRLRGKPCQKRGCSGEIKRIVIGSRSAHFCPAHQKLFQ